MLNIEEIARGYEDGTLISFTELALRLNVLKSTMHWRLDRWDIPTYRLGNLRLVHVDYIHHPCLR